MADYALTPDEWTQIVAPDGIDDVDIRSKAGSFYTSLSRPGECTEVMPAPRKGTLVRRQAVPGFAIFAKGIDDAAVATVISVPR